ncbi:MAG TPA: hypothetical protein VH951_12550 [Dehalococcoidia bacterium]|jgi:hypothetical protein
MADVLETPVGSSCVHHWIVGPPEGDKSSGHCKHCGETRVFMMSPERFTPRSNRTTPAVHTT